jgi:RHS repeat-associated protein
MPPTVSSMVVPSSSYVYTQVTSQNPIISLNYQLTSPIISQMACPQQSCFTGQESGSLGSVPAGSSLVFELYGYAFGRLDVQGSSNSSGTVISQITPTEWVVTWEGGTVNVYASSLPPASTLGSPPTGFGKYDQCLVTKSPVNCATGNFTHTFTDLSVPGDGVPLDLTRTYNSLAASAEGMFGFGWTSSYEMRLSFDSAGDATATGAGGAQATWYNQGSGAFAAAPSVLASLVQNGDGSYTLTEPGGRTFAFSSSGRLTAESDPNGYVTRLAYNGSGQLATVTDPAGRQLTFSYWPGTNLVETVTDPAGRTISYGYNASGDLTGVSGLNGGQSTFGYTNHLLTTMTDPRNDGMLVNVYNSDATVKNQTDMAGRETQFSYGAPTAGGSQTNRITDARGYVTSETYVDGVLSSMTKGVGTSSAATWTYGFDQTLSESLMTDPNGKTWTATYDANGNQTSATDPLSRTTSATYNGLDEPLTKEDANQVTTTYTYDGAGNLQGVSTPFVGSSPAVSQTTAYAYTDPHHPGDPTSMTDPNLHTWSYSYDTYGDLASRMDQDGDKTTYTYSCTGGPIAGCYSNLGLLYTTVAPKGNVTGGNPSQYTTTYMYNALGESTSITDPLGHIELMQYDQDGNRTQLTDGDMNITTYVYDPDNELQQVNQPGEPPLKTGYDADGDVSSQTNGATKVTTYGYDPLDRVILITDPLTRKTAFTYDGNGNVKTVTDAMTRVTTNNYDVANELSSITYSDGVTPNVAFTYWPNGQRKTMTDGTGTSSYFYNSLDELTSETNGDGQIVGYGYDLGADETAITYPNGQTVHRGYDNENRLHTITDWLTNQTTLAYDPNSNQSTTTFPSASANLDSSSYNASDQLTGITMAQGATTLASVAYTRDHNGQVGSDTSTGMNEAAQNYTYTGLNQLQNVNGSPYTYTAADDLSGTPLGLTVTPDVADQIQNISLGGVTIPFTYNANGERTTGGLTPSAQLTYGYDQAGRLTNASTANLGETVAGGEGFTLALRGDGQISAWGGNGAGQLGNGTTTNSTTPVQVSTLDRITAVAAGQNYSVALRNDATVWTWGSNNNGQLGIGNTTNHSTPVQVTSLSGIVAIAAGLGGSHTLALKSGGTVWAWGLNASGQLGNGNTTNQTSPVQVTGLTGTVAIAAGGNHSLAIKSGGTVWAWGANSCGQLGNGTTTNSSTPVQVSGLTGVVAVAAGNCHSVALKSDGTVWTWGDNTYGELGNGTTTSSKTPVQVSALTGVSAIAAGQDHTIALTASGNVYAWGQNTYGQLGNGNTTNQTSPVLISGASNVAAIGSGEYHTIYATVAGVPFDVGKNVAGQLGNGTSTNASTPVQVSNLTSIRALTAETSTYDGDGLRASSTAAGATQHYAWDLSGGTPTLLSDGSTNYIYDDNGLPGEQISSTGTVLYYHHDQLGSTRLLTTSTGASAATFTYDAYGSLTSHTGTADTPLRWAGQYQDPNTGLQYLHARWYDPTTGQFMSVDPLEALTGQPYSYTNNNPVNGSDPSGLCGLSSLGDALDCLNPIEHAGAISGVASVAALIPSPLTPVFGGIAAVTAGVASVQDFSNGNPVGGLLDLGGAGFGAAGVLDHLAAGSYDSASAALRAARTAATDDPGEYDRLTGLIRQLERTQGGYSSAEVAAALDSLGFASVGALNNEAFAAPLCSGI